MGLFKRTTKLRWRRKIRQRRKQAELIGEQTEQKLDKHLFRRLNNLVDVRRFVIVWLLFFTIIVAGVIGQTRSLNGYFQKSVYVGGGIYTEGIIGTFKNANPLFASGAVDSTVSRLLFDGLFKYDSQNKLVGDLASSYSIDDKGLNYTVKLKNDIYWHDAKPVTSADVVFTYQTIQNPDAKSPLRNNWQGIKLAAPDSQTVIFTLPRPLTPFPNSLINGIIPKHNLEGIPPSQLRSSLFNTVNPVGSGPFKWNDVEVNGTSIEEREETVGLVANSGYHEGQPKIDKFIIRSFRDEKRMLESYNKNELDGMVGLERKPDDLSENIDATENVASLTGEIGVFLKNSHEFLQDTKVRQAIVKASNTNAIIAGLGYPVIPARNPLLKSHLGYNSNILQYPQNIPEANALLDSAGWIKNAKGTREKNKKELLIRLFARSTSDYALITQILQKQWNEIGVKTEVIMQQNEDFQSTVAFHNYDALVYGISLGTDPDVLPYWYSSQADIGSGSRLNLSEYKNSAADRALEAGRTKSNSNERVEQYLKFQELWQKDAPAIMLYQPRYVYVTKGSVNGLNLIMINGGEDRLANVNNWMVRQSKHNIR